MSLVKCKLENLYIHSFPQYLINLVSACFRGKLYLLYKISDSVANNYNYATKFALCCRLVFLFSFKLIETWKIFLIFIQYFSFSGDIPRCQYLFLHLFLSCMPNYDTNFWLSWLFSTRKCTQDRSINCQIGKPDFLDSIS